MQTVFNYSMWFYLIWQQPLYCLSPLAQAHFQWAAQQGGSKCRAQESVYPGKLRTNCSCSQDPSLPGKEPELLRCEAPMESPPTIQTCSQENHLTGTDLASGAQGGHSSAFFCQYTQDSYTPIENLSPFICSSPSLQGCGIKYQNRALPEKNLHLHSNASQCELQKYLGCFFF